MSARDIIKAHEGLRLKAYPDPASGGKPWTIGYGHTRDVRPGDICTEAQAEAWLDQDMAEAYAFIDNAVTVPLSEKQRDALCSFVFNVGVGAFQKSTLLRLLNAGDYLGAAAQLPRWTKAAGKSMPALVRRRGEERAWFLAGTNINPEPFPQPETDMAPFLAAAIPALISALPEFAAIFKKDDVSERNVEAAIKAADIIMTATGTTNVQSAVEAVQADPVKADAANEALRANRADLMDALERYNAMEQGNIRAAREYNTLEPLIVNTRRLKLKFWHLLGLTVVLFALCIMGYIIGTSDDIAERTMVLQALLLGGFGAVMAFVFGSSDGSKFKDLRER